MKSNKPTTQKNQPNKRALKKAPKRARLFELLERRELPGLLVHLGLQVRRGQLALRVLLGLLVHRGLQVRRGQLALLEMMGLLVNPDQLVLRGRKDLRDLLGLPG